MCEYYFHNFFTLKKSNTISFILQVNNYGKNSEKKIASFRKVGAHLIAYAKYFRQIKLK